jgi:hypothetical protein
MSWQQWYSLGALFFVANFTVANPEALQRKGALFVLLPLTVVWPLAYILAIIHCIWGAVPDNSPE